MGVLCVLLVLAGALVTRRPASMTLMTVPLDSSVVLGGGLRLDVFGEATCMALLI
jgi:hypothetical protein